MVWPESDANLETTIRAAQQGDPEALQKLAEAFREDVREVCRKFGLTHVSYLSHSDLVQEAWIRILSGLGSFRGGDSPGNIRAAFSGWIQKTAGNVVKNLLQKAHAQKRKPGPVASHGVETITQPDQQSASSVARSAEQEQAIRSAVQTLPEDLRNIVDSCLLRGIPMTEAAQQLGITYEQARYRLSAAISRLKDLLDSNEG